MTFSLRITNFTVWFHCIYKIYLGILEQLLQTVSNTPQNLSFLSLVPLICVCFRKSLSSKLGDGRKKKYTSRTHILLCTFVPFLPLSYTLSRNPNEGNLPFYDWFKHTFKGQSLLQTPKRVFIWNNSCITSLPLEDFRKHISALT